MIDEAMNNNEEGMGTSTVSLTERAFRLWLDALDHEYNGDDGFSGDQIALAKDAWFAQQARIDAGWREAESLAMALWRDHYKEASPDFELCDTVAGVITQIDNMAAGLSERIGALEAENERLREDRDDWEGRYDALYTDGPLHRLESRLHEVREIYAGMEGFEPETAPEAYCLRIIDQMYKAAIGASYD